MIGRMDDEFLEILRQIRDEAKETNSRLESLEGRVDTTNSKLESLEGRVETTNSRLESLEGRVETTNSRLESLDGRVETTNSRLESLDGRVQFLERTMSNGFNELTGRLDVHVERLDLLTRRQTDSELRLASEVLSLADVTREVRDLLSQKLDDHQKVSEHEERIRALEDRIADRSPD